MFKKILIMALAITTLSLAACSSKTPNKETILTPTPSIEQEESSKPTEVPTQVPEKEPIKVIIYEDANIIVEEVDNQFKITPIEGEIFGGIYDNEQVSVKMNDNVLAIKALSSGITTVNFEYFIEDLKFVYYIDITTDTELKMLAAVRMDNDNEVDFDPMLISKDFEDIFTTIYSTIPEDCHPFVQSMSVNIKDPDLMSYYFGNTKLQGLDSAAVSEPMMTSVAYSLGILKFDTNENAKAALSLLKDNAPVNKWVCVSAEKVSARVVKDVYVIFTMTSTETVDLIDAVVIE